MKTALSLLTLAAACALAQIPSITTAPTAAKLAKEAMASAVDAGNGAMAQMADSCARSLVLVWQSPDYTPAEALAAMGDKAVVIFAQHAAAVTYLWTDDARRAVFIAALQRHNVPFTIGQGGAPVFTSMRPYVAQQDGRIVLSP